MKKVFIALAAVALLATACTKAPETKVKVYGWQGEGGNTTEETLQADFSKWKSHGLDGMCYNAGHDLQNPARSQSGSCQRYGISCLDTSHAARKYGFYIVYGKP